SNCSSSLVGIDLAYKNIISGSTDYALVGASTIHSLKNLGYVHL
ncbi:beta-ketoacyl synthase N-terminal-like domain-containing protein, partial [Bacillus subtilis]